MIVKKLILSVASLGLLGGCCSASDVLSNNQLIMEAQRAIQQDRVEAIAACNGDAACIVAIAMTPMGVKYQKVDTALDYLKVGGDLILRATPIVQTFVAPAGSGDSVEITAGGDVIYGSSTQSSVTGTTVGIRNSDSSPVYNNENHKEVIFAPEE